MSDADVLASLDFAADALPCQAADHAAGTGGCEADRGAEYIVETVACQGPGRHSLSPRARGWVCRGYASQLRTNANMTAKCPKCDIRTTIGSLIRVVGPIEFNPRNQLH